MPELTYITTCKGRLKHLQRSLPKAAQQADMQCVVVDYDCPEQSGAWVSAHWPDCRVVHVHDAPRFNAAHARNQGAAIVNGQNTWLAFFDADILMRADFARQVMPLLEPGRFYRASPMPSAAWGSIICRREDFLAIEGYDEAFTGWGGEDDDLIARLRGAGLSEASFPGELVDVIDHDDETRFRFHDLADRQIQFFINRFYTEVKGDLLRITQGPVPLGTRRSLFRRIEHQVTKAIETGDSDTSFELRLPGARSWVPAFGKEESSFALDRILRYRLDTTALTSQKYASQKDE